MTPNEMQKYRLTTGQGLGMWGVRRTCCVCKEQKPNTKGKVKKIGKITLFTCEGCIKAHAGRPPK